MMKPLKGISLGEFPFKELDKVADLIHFDGPLLSLFKNIKGDQYFFYWCDNDEQVNRWLVYRVTAQTVNAYLAKRTSLRDVLLNTPDGLLFSVDIDDDLNYKNPLLVKLEDLPPSYIPSIDSTYKFTPIIDDPLLLQENRYIGSISSRRQSRILNPSTCVYTRRN